MKSCADRLIMYHLLNQTSCIQEENALFKLFLRVNITFSMANPGFLRAAPTTRDANLLLYLTNFSQKLTENEDEAGHVSRACLRSVTSDNQTYKLKVGQNT